jgi:hypothetical protein
LFPLYDYTFAGTDERREAAIWSWADGDFGDQGAAYLRTDVAETNSLYGRWSSQNPTQSLPFACAVSPGAQTNPAGYDWIITSVAGPWANGPQACAAAGGTFWSPQSSLENQRLIAAVNAQRPGNSPWLNYIANNNLILEPVSAGLVPGSTQGSFVAKVEAGKGIPSLRFQYTGGLGGAPTASLEANPVYKQQANIQFNSKVSLLTRLMRS